MFDDKNEQHCVGINRFSKDSYYVFNTKDTLENILKINRHGYPDQDCEVLFVSELGNMDLAQVIEFDRASQQVIIKYRGENFWFSAKPSNVVMKWQVVSHLPENLLPHYSKSDYYILNESLKNLEIALDSYKANKRKHYNNIKSSSDLHSLEKSLENIKRKLQDMTNSGDF